MTNKWRRLTLDTVLIAAFLLAIYFGIRKFFFLVFPIFLALIFSEAIRKSFRRIHPLSPLAKRILIILILLIFFAFLSLMMILLSERLIHFVTGLSSSLGEHMDMISAFCREKIDSAEQFFSRILKRDLQNRFQSSLPSLFDQFLKKILAETPNWLGHLANFFPRFFVSFFIFLVSTYYFSCDWDRFYTFLKRRVSEEKLESLSQWKNRFLRGLGQYTKAYFLLFLLTFTELFLGFVLLRIPGALAKAFFIAFVDVLPILGCGTVLIPWGIFSLITGKTSLGIGLLVLYLVILVVRQIAEPKIVGSSIGLHPALSLILLLTGLRFFGFFGMIFLPLFATCLLGNTEE